MTSAGKTIGLVRHTATTRCWLSRRGSTPRRAFAGYSSQGLLYTAGSTLNVPAGKAFAGTYSFTGPVVCQGTLTASGGPLNFNNGLTVSGSGSISTGGGNVVVNDSVSAITGGTLTAGSEYVGYNGTGLWTHSAGTNTVSNALYLGYNTADSGTYALSATGRLAAATEYVGYNGTGSFTQSGGSNTLSGTLYLGYNATSGGAYNLSGGSLMSAAKYVGYFGTGSFTQSAGTNTLSGALYLGNGATVNGTYSLGGGTLSSPTQYIGYSGKGLFTQTAGVNTASTALISATVPAAAAPAILAAGRSLHRPNTWAIPARDLTRRRATTASRPSISVTTSAAAERTRSTAERSPRRPNTSPIPRTGTFAQSGGTNTDSFTLYLGTVPRAAREPIALSGTGQLSAASEYIGSNSAASASFQQSGGTNAATYLTISSGGQYQLSGGTLEVSGGLVNQGVFSGGNSPATLDANGIVDLTSRHLDKSRRPVGRYGGQFTADCPARIQSLDRLRQLHLVGPDPYAGHHPDRAVRPKFCRRVFDGQPGRLPRDDRGHRRQLDQHEQRTGGLGQRRRQSGRRFPDRERRDLRPERRLALGGQSICRQGRDRPVHPLRRHEHPFGHAVPRLQLGRQRNLQLKRHGQARRCHRVRGLLGDGETSRNRAARTASRAVSTWAIIPAAAAPTPSPAPASCPPRRNTWAIRARGHSHSPRGPTPPARCTSAPTRPATGRTT